MYVDEETLQLGKYLLILTFGSGNYVVLLRNEREQQEPLR